MRALRALMRALMRALKGLSLQAMANSPELLLLDEPTGDLDTRNTVSQSPELEPP